MTKKRRNNHVKRTHRLAKAQLRNLAVVTVAGSNNNQPVVFNLTSLRPVAVNDTVKRAFMYLPFDWVVSMGVAARTQLGDEYIKSQVVSFSGRYDSATEVLNGLQDDIKTQLKSTQYLTEGWIAAPNTLDIDEQTEQALYTAMGAFENKTNWEFEQ